MHSLDLIRSSRSVHLSPATRLLMLDGAKLSLTAENKDPFPPEACPWPADQMLATDRQCHPFPQLYSPIWSGFPAKPLKLKFINSPWHNRSCVSCDARAVIVQGLLLFLEKEKALVTFTNIIQMWCWLLLLDPAACCPLGLFNLSCYRVALLSQECYVAVIARIVSVGRAWWVAVLYCQYSYNWLILNILWLSHWFPV